MNIIVAIAIKNCCIKGQKCNFCQIPEIFSEFEKDLDIFQFDFNYLKKYHSRLVPFLIEIFKADESACECFLNDEFTCSGRDWNNGKNDQLI